MSARSQSANNSSITILAKYYEIYELSNYVIVENKKLFQIVLLCSIKAKIIAWSLTLVAYSIQVYQFLTTKTTQQISDICDGKRRTQNDGDNPRFLKVDSHALYVTGTIRLEKRVTAGNDIFHYEFTLKPKDDLLIVQGSSVGRNDINEFLAQVIENDVRYNVVKQHLYLMHKCFKSSRILQNNIHVILF
jgi:hypothetical protein